VFLGKVIHKIQKFESLDVEVRAKKVEKSNRIFYILKMLSISYVMNSIRAHFMIVQKKLRFIPRKKKENYIKYQKLNKDILYA